jgi:hypothetical protein
MTTKAAPLPDEVEKAISELLDEALCYRDGYGDARENAETIRSHIAALEAENKRLRDDLDGAYLERNRIVAALAASYPSGIKKTAIDGWDDAWHNCVYIDLPTGQASWHYHDREAKLFSNLPAYYGVWDGHTTEEKYQRLAALAQTDGEQPSPKVCEVCGGVGKLWNGDALCSTFSCEHCHGTGKAG